MKDLKQRKINENYWLDRLSGVLPEIVLPRFTAEERFGETKKERIQMELADAAADKLREISDNSDMALFIIFLAGLNVVLCKYTGVADLVIGTLTPRKENVKENIILCRSRIQDDKTFKETLNQVKQDILTDFDHGDYSFGVLYQKLMENQPKVFNISFIYDKLQDKSKLLDQFAVNIVLSAREKRLLLQVEYEANLYQEEIIRRFSRNLIDFLDNIAEKVDLEIKQIAVVCSAEEQELIAFNRTAAPYPHDKTLHSLFEEQAARTPDRTAVVGRAAAASLSADEVGEPHSTEIVHVTYRELNKRANR
ncbi:MAG: condensation domain-containing protein, partial [Candidatus Aminicenantes bacterium]|nr:condensation domain-containing protein [Candidatus Aminicenantes bacterium]